MPTKKLNIMVEISIFAAIAIALDALQGGISKAIFPFLVSGGSIGIAMIPIFIISYRRGLLPGLICGFLVSGIQMLSSIYIINNVIYENEFMAVMGPFFQIMLDYLLAYTVVGFSGVFARSFQGTKNSLFLIIGVLLGGSLKYLCHVISGGLFWLDPDGGTQILGINNSSWLFSFIYNATYMLPNIIISMLILPLIYKLYPKVLDKENKLLVVDEKIDYVSRRRFRINLFSTILSSIVMTIFLILFVTSIYVENDGYGTDFSANADYLMLFIFFLLITLTLLNKVLLNVKGKDTTPRVDLIAFLSSLIFIGLYSCGKFIRAMVKNKPFIDNFHYVIFFVVSIVLVVIDILIYRHRITKINNENEK